MKKFLFVSMFTLLSLFVHASPYSDVHDLDVQIRNFGSEQCILVKKMIMNGSLIESDFPSILAATGERYNFKFRGNTSEAVLNYECGDYKKFTLKLGQYHKKNHKHMSIIAEMLNSIDVFEKHTKKEGFYTANRINISTLQFELSH
ncbi:MAG: hypothetical protein P1U74_09355 [Legionellaceae bacterium]|nr:hypothetical protein [Legionellaceae bacterium]